MRHTIDFFAKWINFVRNSLAFAFTFVRGSHKFKDKIWNISLLLFTYLLFIDFFKKINSIRYKDIFYIKDI